MNAAFVIMLLLSMALSALRGGMGALAQALAQAGDAALSTALSLCGGFMFFGGLIALFERAGLSALLARAMRRPLAWLLGRDTAPETLEAAAMNLSANMLGLGNAATPLGLKAGRLMNAAGDMRASSALCMFLVINATSVQLFPSTVVALRYAAGSENATAIVWPSLAASCVSTAVGIALCKLLERRKR